MLGDARKTSTKSLCQAPNADLGLEGALLYALRVRAEAKHQAGVLGRYIERVD